MINARELNRIIVSQKDLNLGRSDISNLGKNLPDFHDLLTQESTKISILDLEFSLESLNRINRDNIHLSQNDRVRILNGIKIAKENNLKNPALILDDQILVVNSSDNRVENIHNNRVKDVVKNVSSLIIV
ncbi:MAG: hypothetical protein CR982_09265 [Candidatus Cloacimonadota bacterium]|nr:MAG: hypothetical protein CR982_09265 [Candidatus Cloacimonadota bacterium]PIE77498.1 MAG: hypothetical protein CSA15_12555 [Candidatus Delongbacteria bacterium]